MNVQINALSQSLATAQEKNTPHSPQLELEAGVAAREMHHLREQSARSSSRISALETQLVEGEKGHHGKACRAGSGADAFFHDAFKAHLRGSTAA